MCVALLTLCESGTRVAPVLRLLGNGTLAGSCTGTARFRARAPTSPIANLAVARWGVIFDVEIVGGVFAAVRCRSALSLLGVNNAVK